MSDNKTERSSMRKRDSLIKIFSYQNYSTTKKFLTQRIVQFIDKV